MQSCTLSNVAVLRPHAAKRRVFGLLVVASVIAGTAQPLWAQQDAAAGKPAVASDEAALVNRPTDAQQLTVGSMSSVAAFGAGTTSTDVTGGANGTANPDIGATSPAVAVPALAKAAATAEPETIDADVASAPQKLHVPQAAAATSATGTTASAAAATSADGPPAAAAEVDGPAQ